MEFSSTIFIWVFLPLSLLIYGVLGLIIKNEDKRLLARNIFLLIASLIFYAWGGIYYLVLIGLSIIVNYFGAYIIELRAESKKSNKGAFLIVVLVNVLLLVFFKYFNMLVTMTEIFTSGQTLKAMFTSVLKFEGTGALGIKKIALPLAISFYTFQSLSYIADVKKEKIKAEKSLYKFALYTLFFGQITQGPIMRYGDLGPQINGRSMSIDNFAYGIKRFSYGIAKKVLLANTFAEVADSIWALKTEEMGSAISWFGIILYTLQIYYDFSGYTDMAIGVGSMFGFRISENFNYPYTSYSVQEFWRRWHISLSTWFKDYIYIPLGGNRKGIGRTLFNLFVVFLVTGIWHGANMTFICWGLIFAVLSIIERLFLGKLLQKNPIKPVNWLYMIIAVMVGWVFFRAPDLLTANEYLVQMFSFKASQHNTILSFFSMKTLVALLLGVLLCGAVQRSLAKVYGKIKDNSFVMTADVLLQIILLCVSLIMLISGSYNPSIYGNF